MLKSVIPSLYLIALATMSSELHASSKHPNIIRLPVPFYNGGMPAPDPGEENPPAQVGYLLFGSTSLDASSGSARTSIKNDADSPIVLSTNFMMKALCPGLEHDYANSIISDGMRDGLFSADYSSITLPAGYSSSLAFSWKGEYTPNCIESLNLGYSVNGVNRSNELTVRADGVRTGNFAELTNVSVNGHTIDFRINNPLQSKSLTYRIQYSVNGIDEQTYTTSVSSNNGNYVSITASPLSVIPIDVPAFFKLRVNADSISESKDYEFAIPSGDIRWLRYEEIYSVNGSVRETHHSASDLLHYQYNLEPISYSAHSTIFTLPPGAHVVYKYDRGTDYYPNHHNCPSVTATVEGSAVQVETTTDPQYCMYDVNLESAKGKVASINFSFSDSDMNQFVDSFDYR